MPVSDLNSSLGLKTDLPLALFPVRLETHFKDNNLWVRIYPDTIHVDSFEPELTEIEITWGKNFWRQTWLAGKDEARERSAWAQLAEHFGAARAAWIAQILIPENLERQPSSIPPDSILPVEPKFPEPDTHKEAWTRAPHTQILPDKWIVLIYESDESSPLIFEGNAIKLPLDVSISPKKGKGLNADSLKDDSDIGWLVNFEKAVEKGMGLSIPNAPKNIKRLVVLGVNTTFIGKQGPQELQEGQKKLQELIQAHHHTQGISFLRQGTPTNNTDDAPSGYSTLDPGFENSYRTERKAASKLVENSNRAVTARALGVDDEIFAHVREADAVEQLDAQRMNTALWQATWGYFMEQMMAGPDAPSEQSLRQARSHFEQYVRARGPLPAIRIGTQPYGVLPVISLKHWQPKKGDAPIDASLVPFLHKLREVWRNSLACVPKVPGGTSSFEELQNILNIAPVSVNYQRRPAQRIALLSASPSSEAHLSGNQTSKNKAKDFGLTWTPRQIRMVYGKYPPPSHWPGEMITPSTGENILGKDYQAFCQELMTKSFADIQKRTLSSTTDSLFFWLLREACLREYLVAACRLLKLPPEECLESEYEEGEAKVWKVLERPLPNQTPPKVSDYLDKIKEQLGKNSFVFSDIKDVSADIATELKDFAAFFISLHYLSQQSSNLLDGLFRETLDLCSHRYDAWVTSFATKRLEVIRTDDPQGIYLGGYGWVEDIKPASTLDNHGFIHAPSLAHATTAALLRSGYVSRTDPRDREALAINLSSERIRIALWLLDGVRQGQSLGALLGYRFERGLHENHPGILLDHYIPFFRKIAPLNVDALASMTNETISAQPATQVVDGLALLRIWKNRERVIPWEKYDLPTIPVPHKKACQDELERLEDAVDAISDLVIAESVHHVAQGNPVRVGATLSAIAEGEAPPPELDVIRTPRTGIGITHRIAVVFSGLPKGPVWGAQTARALAEPYLNAWAAELLGPLAGEAVCHVEYLNPDPVDKNKTIVLDQKTIKLNLIGLAPIDLLYLPESEGDAQRSELEQRVIYLAQRSLPANVSSAAEIRLIFNRDLGSLEGAISFAEVLEVARVARRMVTSARALGPRDLAQPDQSMPPEAESDVERPGESLPLALNKRAEAAIKDFKEGCNKLIAALPENEKAPINSEDVRDYLMQLSAFGLPGAVPLAPTGDTIEVQNVLRSQAQSIAHEVAKRLDRLNSLDKEYKKLEPNDQLPAITRDYHVARLREVFGQEFRVLPRFNPINTADLHSTFAASNELQGNNPLACVTWFQRVVRVREGAARLDAALMYAEAMGGSKLGFTVGQLPYMKPEDNKPKELWAALPGDLSGSRLSLVVHAPAGLDLTTGPVAGLLIDEWVEVVPSKEEITGVTFNYNAPQARAPQAVLLAVAPNDQAEWSLGMLTDTVVETLELAKLRTVDLSRLLHKKQDPPEPDKDKPCEVDPNTLTDIGQFLPALYFPPVRAPEWKEKTS
ncbi:MAG: hypothetical protein Q8L02_00810 [Candidatus Nitrotoga sp.]|nr:hypothetical protein [Candidatus Nitrotoga sp.]